MKVKIDSVNIDEKKNEIALMMRVEDEKGVILKKDIAAKIPVGEYSKERVLAMMRAAGVKQYLESKKPVKIEKKLIMKELKDLTHEVDETQISAFELKIMEKAVAPPGIPKTEIEPKKDESIGENK